MVKYILRQGGHLMREFELLNLILTVKYKSIDEN